MASTDWKTEAEDGLERVRLADAKVEVIAGPDLGKVLQIGVAQRVIGTGSQADLRLSDPRVSRRHVVLVAEPEGVRLVDPGSRNGTRIGAVVIHDARATEDCVLSIGGTELALRFTAPVEIQISPRTSFGEALGKSRVMRQLFALLEPAAKLNVTVLLEGDSGTGKDVLARSIHQEGPRAKGPFIEVDCASIPANLVESELFGHERGAFTGAVGSRVGAFERADGGTLFLDEVGELPLEIQPKLLRVLETRAFQRVGGTSKVQSDVRVVAATNRLLRSEVRAGRFREDLFYRLSVIHVRVPPLAQRTEDIPALASKFLRGVRPEGEITLPPQLLRLFTAYSWPGNARELRNVIERFATFGTADPSLLFGGRGAGRADNITGSLVDLARLADELSFSDGRRRLLRRFEDLAFESALKRSDGSVSRAAELLGLPRATAYRIVARLRKKGDPDGQAEDAPPQKKPVT